MRTIPVASYPISPRFSSAEAAIQHALSYLPLAQAKADAKLVLGSQIIDGFWTDTEFVVRFSNGRVLHVSVDPALPGRSVKWHLLDREPELPAAEVRRVGSAPVMLEWAKVGDYVMDQSALMASRRGKEFKSFFVNELEFYLYTPRQRILCFGCVYRRDTGENLLYVHEDD